MSTNSKERRDSKLSNPPNLFIVGAPKAGTTAFVEQLANHSEVFVPEIKEPHYFFYGEDTSWYYYKSPMILNLNSMNKLYQGASEFRFIVDGTVHYMRFSKIISKKIKENCKNVKIIAIVREPEDRIKSHYLMDIRSGVLNKRFEDVWCTKNKHRDEYIECSNYLENINVFVSEFGSGNVLVIDFLDFKNNNSIVMDKVQDFLGIKKEDLQIIKSNEYRSPKGILKIFYKSYWLRKVYNKITPKFIKAKFKNYMFDKRKPDSIGFVPEEILSSLVNDHDEVKKKYVDAEY